MDELKHQRQQSISRLMLNIQKLGGEIPERKRQHISSLFQQMQKSTENNFLLGRELDIIELELRDIRFDLRYQQLIKIAEELRDILRQPQYVMRVS